MFTTLIVQPIFNLLVLIYALLPGHNFGLAIIIFTVVVRMALWPLVRKQLRQVKVMRKLQPEIKEIQKKYKKDRQKMQLMLMELYKERGVNPLGTIGILIPQFIILIGLYSGLNKVVHDPGAIVSFAYPALQDLSWMRQLGDNLKLFDETLFGIVDLTRAASSSAGIYVPALIIAAASSIVQYFQSKQLLPDAKDARKLREILKAAGQGEQADQSEVQAATSRSMIFILPVIIFFVTIGLPSALGLYWLVGGIVAIIQQTIILREDEETMETIGNKAAKRDVKTIPEAEVIATAPVSTTPKKKKASGKNSAKKRRKK
jgi:YidC/Oxa1 family membrane protein insertase